MIIDSLNAMVESGIMFLGSNLVIFIKRFKTFMLFYQVVTLLKIYSGFLHNSERVIKIMWGSKLSKNNKRLTSIYILESKKVSGNKDKDLYSRTFIVAVLIIKIWI